MNPHDRAVDHLNLGVVSFNDRRQCTVPHTARAPAHEPVVAGGPGSLFLRQGPPRRSGPQNPDRSTRGDHRREERSKACSATEAR
jgi:hypothetical protein